MIYLIGFVTGATVMYAADELLRGQFSSAAWEIAGIIFFNFLMYMTNMLPKSKKLP